MLLTVQIFTLLLTWTLSILWCFAQTFRNSTKFSPSSNRSPLWHSFIRPIRQTAIDSSLNGFEKSRVRTQFSPIVLNIFGNVRGSVTILASFSLFYLDARFMNTFQKIPECFKQHYNISQHISNTFKTDHHRDIVSGDFYITCIFIVDNRGSLSNMIDVRCSSISSASARNSHTKQHISARPLCRSIMTRYHKRT